MKKLKTVIITFDGAASHSEVIQQFVDGLVREKFASRKEIIEHLEMSKVLLTPHSR